MGEDRCASASEAGRVLTRECNACMNSTAWPADPEAIDNSHYLRVVADLGDRRAVVTQDAIYSSQGIKLVDQGVRIDSRLGERLLQHKLREPVDAHLKVDSAVDAAALVAGARELIGQAPLLRRMAEVLGDAGRLTAPLGAVPLPPPMAFKLTVMREQWPALFTHSLHMTVVSLFLGLRSGLDETACVPLAAAALLHDIGALHMDPAWRDPGQRMSGPQRRQLSVHPITAMLLVRDQRVYPAEVEAAVLEHHERLDGSGYPRGLRGEEISVLGRILLLAEVASAIYEKYEDMPARRLSLVLRLNHRKFAPDLVAQLLALLRGDASLALASAPPGEAVQRSTVDLASAFEQWAALKAALPPGMAEVRAERAFRFVESRLQALLMALTEAGNHPKQQAILLEHLGDDMDSLVEVALVGGEAWHELQNLVHTCHRRWPRLRERASPGDAAVADWCDWLQRRT